MSNLPNRVREFRKARGMTLEQLADAANTTPAQVSRLERGVQKLTVDWLKRLGAALDATPADLIEPSAGAPLPSAAPTLSRPGSYGRRAGMSADGYIYPAPDRNAGEPGALRGATVGEIAILGMARGGVDQEMFSDGPIDFHPMPPFLARVPGAYGLVVAGDSMHPRYRDGVVVYVNPHARPTIGAGVVIQKRSRTEQRTPGSVAIVKEFVRNLPDGVEVKEYTPSERSFVINKEEIFAVHVIAGTRET